MLKEQRFSLILTAVEGRDAVFCEETLTTIAACFFAVQARRAAAREAIAELVAAPDPLILQGGSTLARLSEMLPASRC